MSPGILRAAYQNGGATMLSDTDIDRANAFYAAYGYTKASYLYNRTMARLLA